MTFVFFYTFAINIGKKLPTYVGKYFNVLTFYYVALLSLWFWSLGGQLPTFSCFH